MDILEGASDGSGAFKTHLDTKLPLSLQEDLEAKQRMWIPCHWRIEKRILRVPIENNLKGGLI